jgi:hypothetical protein
MRPVISEELRTALETLGPRSAWTMLVDGNANTAGFEILTRERKNAIDWLMWKNSRPWLSRIMK